MISFTCFESIHTILIITSKTGSALRKCHIKTHLSWLLFCPASFVPRVVNSKAPVIHYMVSLRQSYWILVVRSYILPSRHDTCDYFDSIVRYLIARCRQATEKDRCIWEHSYFKCPITERIPELKMLSA